MYTHRCKHPCAHAVHRVAASARGHTHTHLRGEEITCVLILFLYIIALLLELLPLRAQLLTLLRAPAHTVCGYCVRAIGNIMVCMYVYVCVYICIFICSVANSTLCKHQPCMHQTCQNMKFVPTAPLHATNVRDTFQARTRTRAV